MYLLVFRNFISSYCVASDSRIIPIEHVITRCDVVSDVVDSLVDRSVTGWLKSDQILSLCVRVNAVY